MFHLINIDIMYSKKLILYLFNLQKRIGYPPKFKLANVFKKYHYFRKNYFYASVWKIEKITFDILVKNYIRWIILNKNMLKKKLHILNKYSKRNFIPLYPHILILKDIRKLHLFTLILWINNYLFTRLTRRDLLRCRSSINTKF